MDKKQKAWAELRALLEGQREYTEAKLRQFDGFFDKNISEDNFDGAAEAKDMQGRLERLLDTINAALANMSKENIERYLKESNGFATHCEKKLHSMSE